MRRWALLVLALALPGFLAAQSFDSFEQTTLPPGPLPDGTLPQLPELPGADSTLNAPWLDGGSLLLEGGGSDDGITLRTGPTGQSGVRLETFPGVTGPVTSVSQPPTTEGRRVTLRALDRMLGRPTDIELEIGQTVLFGRIAIHVSECRFPVDNPASDAFAHVRVFDTGGNALFDGWMVATSPALSALEHPRYDVWVLRCANTS